MSNNTYTPYYWHTIYLDYSNNIHSISKFAKHYNLTGSFAMLVINAMRKVDKDEYIYKDIAPRLNKIYQKRYKGGQK